MSKLLITINGKKYEVELEILEEDNGGMYPAMPSYGTPVAAHHQYAPAQAAPMAPRPAAPSPVAAVSASGDALPSPINGVVLEVPVTVGKEVKEGEVVVVLEAMKMKTNIASPRNGKIKSVNVKVNDTVESGQELVSFE